MNKPIDRSADLSQPVDKLGPDEKLKLESDYLRGTINTSLLDRITDAVPFSDNKLLKFHGMYQQDNRDTRDDRRRRKLEPDFTFMIRVRLPGGVCQPAQWLKIDEIARAHARDTIRLTTRQTFQLHWVVKKDVRPTIQGLHDVLLDTVAACGDDSRGVMATANPSDGKVHAEVATLSKQLSDHVIPKTRAYAEIWYGEERVASTEPEEPFYGPTYLPRKFKVGFAIPPANDIDIYTQDLGYIAIVDGGELKGFNITIGGGMGRTDNDPETYPRLADLIGYVDKTDLLASADAVMGVQRDYGNRKERKRARFKYTIDDKGLEFIKGDIERRLGKPLQPARPFTFTENHDHFGWAQIEDGSWNYTLFIDNGRVSNLPGRAILDGMRAIAQGPIRHIRITPSQNVIIAGVAEADKAAIEAILDEHGLAQQNDVSPLRRIAFSCVALPSCGLAMAEAERYLPDLIGKVEALLADRGLAEQPIVMRMTGCPNGCARPYVAEIGFTGRAPGKYNLYLGGGFHGERLNRLHRANIGEAAILEELGHLFDRYKAERREGEYLGDFVSRVGYVDADGHHG
jgi:sulfite reductase (NADPH) hemoprotein beta-component